MTRLVLALLWGCNPVVLDGPGTAAPAPGGDDGSSDGGDGGGDGGDGGGGTETVPGLEGAAPWLFTLDAVHAVDLEIPAEGIDALWADPYSYVDASVHIDGERLDDVAVRIKGKLGSYRNLNGKSAFRVDLNRNIDGQNYHGLKALTLNNMVNDYAQLHERVVYPLYQANDVQGLRVGYVWLTVNGEDFGLYANIETPDDVWLKRAYGDDDGGNLYEADYLLYEDGSYTLFDFDEATYQYLELDEGEDVGHADLWPLVDAIATTGGTDAFYAATGQYLDWAQFHRFWAAEIWVGQWDGYNYNSNNYRLYVNPRSGLIELLPWGQDWTFSDWRTWTAPVTLLGGWCLQHAECTSDFEDALIAVSATMDAQDVSGQVDEIKLLIDPYVAADPRKELDAGTIAGYQTHVQSWALIRSKTIAGLFGLADPEVVVGEVLQGETGLVQSVDDLDWGGALVRALDVGGTGIHVNGVDFVASDPTGATYGANVPDLPDQAGWSALETLLYSCGYTSPGLSIDFAIPVEAGEDHLVQLLFFETYYASWGYRKVDIEIEGQTMLTGLDTSSGSHKAGLRWVGRVNSSDGTLDIRIHGVTEGSDGYPAINGVLVHRL